MHITAPRVLGMLMFLGLIGYAFFLAPWLTAAGSAQPASAHAPASRATAAAHAPAAAAPTPAAVLPQVPQVAQVSQVAQRAPLSRAE